MADTGAKNVAENSVEIVAGKTAKIDAINTVEYAEEQSVKNAAEDDSLTEYAEAECACAKCNPRICMAKKQEDIAQSCSCEDCQESKTCLYYDKKLNEKSKSENQSATSTENPQTIREIIISNLTKLMDFFKSKPAQQPTQELVQRPAQFIIQKPTQTQTLSPAEIKAMMIDTLKKEGNYVEVKKRKFLPCSNTKCEVKSPDESQIDLLLLSPSQAYEVMKETLEQQTTLVDSQKTCYMKKSKASDRKRRTSASVVCSLCEIMKEKLDKQTSVSETLVCRVCHNSQKSEDKSEECICKQKQHSVEVKDRKKVKGPCGNVTRIINANWNTIETPYNAYYYSLIDKQESLDYLQDSAGYVFELPKIYKRQSKNGQDDVDTQNFTEDLVKMQKNIYLCYNNEMLTPSNTCSMSLTNTEYNTISDESETSSLLKINTQVYHINRLETDNTKSDTIHIFDKANNSACSNSATNTIELPNHSVKYKPTRNAQQLFKSILQSRDGAIETPTNGYQLTSGEHNHLHHQHHNQCFKDQQQMDLETSKNMHELPKCSLTSTKQKKSCSCRESPKKHSQSSGCVPEQRTYSNLSYKSVKKTQEMSLNRLEMKTVDCEPNNTSGNKKHRCSEDNGSGKNKYPSSVYELLPPIKLCKSTAQKNDDNKNKMSECLKSAKTKSESPAYVIECPKHAHNTQQKSNCKCRISANSNSKSSRCAPEPHVCKNTSLAPINNARVSSINGLETKCIAADFNNSLFNNKQCCSESVKTKSESSGYVLEIPKYLPKHNEHKKEMYDCNVFVKHKSGKPEYVKMPRYPQKSISQNKHESKMCEYNKSLQKSSYESRELAKDNLKSLGIFPHLQTDVSSLHEQANNTPTFNINKLKTNWIASDPNNTLMNEKKICDDYIELGINKLQSAGSVELCKHTKDSSKRYVQKRGCSCNEVVNYNSHKKPERGSEQQNQRDSRVIPELRKSKPTLAAGVYDLPIYKDTQKTSTDIPTDLNENKNSECYDCKKHSQGHENEVPKLTHKTKKQKSSCVCHESANKISESPGYVLKSPTKHYEHQKNESDRNELKNYKSNKSEKDLKQNNKINSCGLNAQLVKRKPKLPECDYDVSQSQKSSCKNPDSVITTCKLNSLLPGYVLDLPIYTQESCSKLTQKTSKLPLEPVNNAEACSINKFESKSVQSDPQTIWNSMVGTQTMAMEELKSLILSHPESKNTIDLCKDILKTQMETIEVLKKIYFPQNIINNMEPCQNYEFFTNTYCNPLPNLTELSDNIKKFKNSATQSDSEKPSAELLVHMPPPDPNDSLASGQSIVTNKPKKITKSEILMRLKEAYEACSCKICECVANKPVTTNTCKSKRWECNECSTLSFYQKNELQIRVCKPHNCDDCTKSFADQCRCDPCQCGDCKTRSLQQRQTLVVAPVEREQNAALACSCSPCACMDCGLVYPLGSSVVNEVSTSTNRHALCRCEVCLNERCDQSFDSCRCQNRNKVMSKPFVQDTHNFDIRTAIVHKKQMIQRVGRNDAIALFTANRYPTVDFGCSYSQTCKECESIYCGSQKDAINAIKSNLFSSSKTRTKAYFNDTSDGCNFKLSCELQTNGKVQNCDVCDQGCVCGTCSSLDCDTRPFKNSSVNLDRLGRYPNSDGTYERCYRLAMTGSEVHPFKKGDILTPSTHKLKVQNQILQKQLTTNTDSRFKLPNFNNCNNFNGSSQLKTLNKIRPPNMDTRCRTFQRDTYMHCQTINKIKSAENKTAIENEIYGSWFSAHSSSCHIDNGSNTPMSRNQVNLLKGCYPNNPERFLQFLKGTVETSEQDVKEIYVDETLKLDKCNMFQSSTEKHNLNDTYSNIISNENGFNIDESYHLSNNKLIARPIETNNKLEPVPNASWHHNHKLEIKDKQSGNQNEIRKKSENKITQNKGRDQLQVFTHLIGSHSSLDINHEGREYINAIREFNEFYFTHELCDYNNISERNKKRDNSISNYPKQTPCTELVNYGTDILNGHDYKRVRNTLKEAKEFSLELMRLLKTYEKANLEFESILGKAQIIP